MNLEFKEFKISEKKTHNIYKCQEDNRNIHIINSQLQILIENHAKQTSGLDIC